MNTYNDNLRSTVFDSLQTQELDLTKLKAQLLASKLSLYYAQGARISAQEKLQLATEELTYKTKEKEQAVKNANISTNVLASANQEKTYMDLSVKNTATAASNVQIAANSILKIASDIGSIYSIVHASDYKDDIYDLALNTKDLMKKTARHAEEASLFAMESATYAAQVSYKKVASQSALTNTSIDAVLKTVDSEYNAASALVNSDNTALAAESVKERVVEGQLEDVNVDYNASISAYNSLNSELNLDLKVNTVPNNSKVFNLSFNPIVSPFQSAEQDASVYPVEAYYAVVVKYKNRATFGLSEAEKLLQKDNKGTRKYLTKIKDNTPADTHAYGYKLTAEIDINHVYDAEGDDVVEGKNYVVFIFAQYVDAYRREINNFEEFLSSPSLQFCLKRELQSPDEKSIKVITVEEEAEVDINIDFDQIQTNEGRIEDDIEVGIDGKLKKKFVRSTMKFQINNSMNRGTNVEYRCMFLPTGSITKGLLTKSGLKSIVQEAQNYELIEQEYFLERKKLMSDLNTLEGNIKKLTAEAKIEENQYQDIPNLMENLEETIKNSKDKKIVADAKKEIKLLNDLRKALLDVEKNQAALEKLEEDKSKAIKAKKHIKEDVLGFFFDTDIAETVSAANYLVPKIKSWDIPPESELVHTREIEVPITANTTDNFGSPLIKGDEYIPVILTVSTEDVVEQSKYQSHLTNYDITKKFKYQTIVNSKK